MASSARLCHERLCSRHADFQRQTAVLSGDSAKFSIPPGRVGAGWGCVLVAEPAHAEDWRALGRAGCAPCAQLPAGSADWQPGQCRPAHPAFPWLPHRPRWHPGIGLHGSCSAHVHGLLPVCNLATSKAPPSFRCMQHVLALGYMADTRHRHRLITNLWTSSSARPKMVLPRPHLYAGDNLHGSCLQSASAVFSPAAPTSP